MAVDKYNNNRVTLYLKEDIRNKLKAITLADNCSKSSLVSELIENEYDAMLTCGEIKGVE